MYALSYLETAKCEDRDSTGVKFARIKASASIRTAHRAVKIVKPWETAGGMIKDATKTPSPKEKNPQKCKKLNPGLVVGGRGLRKPQLLRGFAPPVVQTRGLCRRVS